jgi:DNA invertase Pin-like site-specific DNA recombinase
MITSLDLQLDTLKEAGCQRIYQDEASGKTAARPQLRTCLDALRPGDTLCVWRLDRLGRSLGDLIEIISTLSDQGIEFESLIEGIDGIAASGSSSRTRSPRR